MRIAVLTSSSGSILDAIVSSGINVDLVVVDRDCPACNIAKKHSIKLVEHLRSFGPSFDRESYSKTLAELLKSHSIELVVMAGFGTVLSKEFFEDFPNRVLNTHPSLLPAFKGWHAVRDALLYGVKVTGTTVHIATDQVDQGPILAQEPVRILEGDDEQSLHERIKQIERWLYPKTIKEYINKLEKES